jgi:hypothetical protein
MFFHSWVWRWSVPGWAQLSSICLILRLVSKVKNLSGISSHRKAKKYKSLTNPLSSHWPQYSPWTSWSQREGHTTLPLDNTGKSHGNEWGYLILLQERSKYVRTTIQSTTHCALSQRDLLHGIGCSQNGQRGWVGGDFGEWHTERDWIRCPVPTHSKSQQLNSWEEPCKVKTSLPKQLTIRRAID